jgi:hypothetical protein
MTKTLEMCMRIWNDKTGDSIEIGEDRDGLDMIEIRSRTDDGKVSNAVTMDDETALLLVDSVQRVLEFRKSRKP